jgi:hypothetical protein
LKAFCPPAGVDPGISVPPVGGGVTPVIPPPGSLRTGLAVISLGATNSELPIAKSIRAAEAAVNSWYQQEKLAA